MTGTLNGAGIEEIRNQVAIELVILDEEIIRTTAYLTDITLQRDQLRAARYVMTIDDPLDLVQMPNDCIGCSAPTWDTDAEGVPLCGDCAGQFVEAEGGVAAALPSPFWACNPDETVADEPPAVEPATENDQELHPSAGEGAGLQQSTGPDAGSTSGERPGAAPDTAPEMPSWAEIAAVWIDAARAGVPTTEALAARYNHLPFSTVKNWPTKLRKHDLIPPAGVDLDDWQARKAAAAADSPGITGQVGYQCETDGCTFTAPEGIDGRSRIRTHARETHGRKATAFELTAGVIE